MKYIVNTDNNYAATTNTHTHRATLYERNIRSRTESQVQLMLTHSHQSQWFNSKWKQIYIYETLAGSNVLGVAVGACLPASYHTTLCVKWSLNALNEHAAFKRSALIIYSLHNPMNDVPGEQNKQSDICLWMMIHFINAT